MGQVALIGKRRSVYRVLVGNLEGERPRRRWEILKMNIREIGWNGVDWIDLVRSCEHGNEPPNFHNIRRIFSNRRETPQLRKTQCVM